MNESGKGIVLLTGASAGIGAETARQLVAGGWRVIGAARRAERLAELAAELGEAFLPLNLDVNDPARTGRLIEDLPEAWRAIEVLVNNAGGDVGGRVRFDQGDVEDWTGTIETNLNGVIRVTRAVVPGMLERGRGQIVIVSSLSGVEPFADDGAYIAAKAGAHGLAQALRHDYAASAIKVTEILPGTARSEFATNRWRGDQAKADVFYDAFPELLDVASIARAILFAIEQPGHVAITEVRMAPNRR